MTTMTHTTGTTVTATGLTKTFGDRSLWRDLGFTVEPGQMVALTGPSGSGKSTLLNCIGLLEPVTSGSIMVNGRDVTKFRSAAARRFRRDVLGYLFQNYALIDNASIAFNLKVAVGAHGRPAPTVSFDEALQRVGLGGRGAEPVYRLSGGEQQRVALARLIVKQPAVVLADEPTGALDAGNADMVIASLRAMAEQGCAVIIATHSQHVAGACTSTIDLGAR